MKILFQVDQTVLGTESEKQEPVSTPEQIKPQWNPSDKY